jgi:two-component system chemotaxis sensor kinase CheA
VNFERYRAVFLEESSDQLAELTRGLLALEKDAAHGESIDLVFRMAHSIKGMAASLDYAPIAECAHDLENAMQEVRRRGRAEGDELTRLFARLEELESLIGVVRQTGECPPQRAAAKKKTLKPS